VSPTWHVPHENKPAPGDLLLVQAFVNTWDGSRAVDVLLDPAAAVGWLTSAGMWNGPAAPDLYELAFTRNLREAVRLLLVTHSGGPAPAPGELQPLHALSSAARLSMGVGPDGAVTVRPARDDGLEAQLARLLLIIGDAQLRGTWQRLKTCANPDCRWAFYDRSHSQQGAWCEMKVCGNRAKNRRFKQRNRPNAGGARSVPPT
jgi:predicted RNA-binding Zn ribbon-like protein